MIFGKITLEDHQIDFQVIEDRVKYIVKDSLNMEHEILDVSAEDFLKALAIAVHPDGMPDYKLDYPAAERAQGKLRWIP
jgi:hypothetical protein